MPEIGSARHEPTTYEEVEMKLLLQALTSDAPAASAPRRAPSSVYPCAPARLRASSLGRNAAMALSTKDTLGRFATLHRANRLMVIPTDAHRRPPATPT